MSREESIRAHLARAVAEVRAALALAPPFPDAEARLAAERLAGEIAADVVRLAVAAGAHVELPAGAVAP